MTTSYMTTPNDSTTMQIEIFTDASGTTADRDKIQSVLDFFQGDFLSVKNLAMNLKGLGDVTTHILSDEFGCLQGSDPVTSLSKTENKDGAGEFTRAIVQATQTADVVVILLTQSHFQDTVAAQWSELASNAKQDSIWCFGASRTALSSIDLEEIHSSVETIIVYQRVGVARISSERKEQLLEAVSSAAQ